MRAALALAAAGLLGACTCAPEFLDCQVRCGTKGLCPEGTECNTGFCRPAGFTGTCTCRPGEQRECGGSMGECHPGTQRCTDQKQWAPCTGEGVATPEICDLKDNDCNGAVDDAVGDSFACEKKVGVCAGKVHGCVDGVLSTVCTAADYGPDYEAAETRCDGLDNDCDGRTDFLRPVKLSADAGLWSLVGLDGGYALALAGRSADGGYRVEGRVYDAQLQLAVGPVVLAEGPGALVALAGVARGERAVFSLAEQAAPPAGPLASKAVVWSRDDLATPLPLLGLPPADERGAGLLRVGLPLQGAVGGYLTADGGAALLYWAADTSTPTPAAFAVPGVTLARVDQLVLSAQGASARWAGAATDDAGQPLGAGVVTLDQRRVSRSTPLGALFESRSALQSAWGESINQLVPTPINYSGVAVQYDVWDGGVFLLRQAADFRTIGNVAATAAPAGLFLGWTESGALWVATPLTGTSNLRSAALGADGGLGSVANLQVANAGGSWNVVGYEQAGLNALLVCAP